MKKCTKFLTVFSTQVLIYVLPVVTLAQNQVVQSQNRTAPADTRLQNPLGEGTSLNGFLLQLLDAVLVLAIPIIVFFIIYAGFLYVTARGNAESISKAHKALLYALIGGVLIIGARALLAVIEGTVKSFG